MRAVKIDPVSRTVTEINLKKNPNNTLQELYEIIGCDLVEMVQIDQDMVMVVDEEGKCKDVQGAFPFIGSGIIIAGTAIILGGSGDSFKALPEKLASFQMMTEWVEPADVPPPQASVIAFKKTHPGGRPGKSATLYIGVNMETENIMNLKNLIIKLQKCTIPNDIPDEDIVLACKFLQETLKLPKQNYQ